MAGCYRVEKSVWIVVTAFAATMALARLFRLTVLERIIAFHGCPFDSNAFNVLGDGCLHWRGGQHTLDCNFLGVACSYIRRHISFVVLIVRAANHHWMMLPRFELEQW